MCIVHDITDYLADGGDSFRTGDEDDPDKKKIKLAQQRLKKAHGYSTANAVVDCAYRKDDLHLNEANEEAGRLPAGKSKLDDPHPPHAAPCSRCGKTAEKSKYHGLDRTDMAKAVAERYLAKIQAKSDPLKDGMTRHSTDGKMAGVLICVDPGSGALKVIKAHSGPGLGPDFAELDCYAEMLERTPEDAATLAEKREALAALPPDAWMSSDDRGVLNQAAIDADAALTDLTDAAFDRDNPEPTFGDLPDDQPARDTEKKRRKDEKRDHKKNRKKAAQDARKDAKRQDAGTFAPDAADPPEVAQMKAAKLDYKNKKARADAVNDGAVARRKAEKEEETAAQKMLVGNFAEDTKTDIANTCIKPGGKKTAPDGNCGVCAAPKLLMAARANGLVPVSIAEFWVGAEKDGWKEGAYIDSCSECMKFLGTMMCGIEEKQSSTDTALNAKLT